MMAARRGSVEPIRSLAPITTLLETCLRPALDFWFDFASTYSYPAAMRIRALAQAAGVTVRWRPFLLGPIFKAQGWDNSPFNLYEAKGRYMWRDLERMCGALDLPFRKPDPFPQSGLVAARVALVGARRGLGRGIHRRACIAREFARRPSDRRSGRGPRYSASRMQSSRSDIFDRTQADAIKTRLRNRPRKRSGSAFSVRRASSLTANCSGAMTGWNRLSPGPRSDKASDKHGTRERVAALGRCDAKFQTRVQLKA